MTIPEKLKSALAARGIREATAIQKLVIPELENPENGSLVFTSPTGTGKTLAYLVPILCTADRASKNIDALILAPTHELCSQIKGEIEFVLKSCDNEAAGGSEKQKAALLIGSVSLRRQIETLKKTRPAAAVGNPARVLQLLNLKKLNLKNLRFLVLDEGDRLFAEELRAETEALVSAVLSISPECRIIACSATFSENCRKKLALSGGSWKRIDSVEDNPLASGIDHWAFFCEEREKTDTLRSFIAAVKPKKLLVFSSRSALVGTIVSRLQKHHLAASGILSGMDKRARKAALDDFRKGAVNILVSTDLVCRGLDIAGITHIAAMDIPDSEETYLHRAGRTARAGKRGVMASFGDEEELMRLRKIEKRLHIRICPKELYGGRLLDPG